MWLTKILWLLANYHLYYFCLYHSKWGRGKNLLFSATRVLTVSLHFKKGIHKNNSSCPLPIFMWDHKSKLPRPGALSDFVPTIFCIWGMNSSSTPLLVFKWLLLCFTVIADLPALVLTSSPQMLAWLAIQASWFAQWLSINTLIHRNPQILEPKFISQWKYMKNDSKHVQSAFPFSPWRFSLHPSFLSEEGLIGEIEPLLTGQESVTLPLLNMRGIVLIHPCTIS